jgi:folate-dependent phosphoribosylglycinamide formyltransferase PurN
MYQIGWFTTARGKGSQALLMAIQNAITRGDIEAEVAFVFLSREPGEAAETDNFIAQVKDHGIPLICYSYRHFKQAKGAPPNQESGSLAQWRFEYDRRVMAQLKRFQPDLCVLAGYMLIVGQEMCTRYNMINLHPAAPDGPVGTWMDVIWQLIEERATETGVMMHLVTPELDEGPVVSYCKFTIRGEPFEKCWKEISNRTAAEIQIAEGEDNTLFKLIRKHGQVRELPLMTTTIKAFSQGRIQIKDNRPIGRDGTPINGHDLSVEIDEIVHHEVSGS